MKMALVWKGERGSSTLSNIEPTSNCTSLDLNLKLKNCFPFKNIKDSHTK